MKRQISLAALLLLSLSLSLSLSASQEPRQVWAPSRAEHDILLLENMLREADLHADISALSRMLPAEYISIRTNGQLRNRNEVLSDMHSGDLKYDTLSYDHYIVRVYGNAAVVSGRGTVIGAMKGQHFEREIRFTRMYVKQKGQWRVVANQATRIS